MYAEKKRYDSGASTLILKPHDLLSSGHSFRRRKRRRAMQATLDKDEVKKVADLLQDMRKSPSSELRFNFKRGREDARMFHSMEYHASGRATSSSASLTIGGGSTDKDEVKKTHYDTLGVSLQATEQEIRSAYRRLAKEFHPDSTRSTSGTDAQFKDVNEAYKVLSDPEKREEYDKSLRVRPHQMNLESMADVFARRFSRKDASLLHSISEPAKSSEYKRRNLGTQSFSCYEDIAKRSRVGERLPEPKFRNTTSLLHREEAGQQLQTTIPITLEETAHGCTRTIEIMSRIRCDACGCNGNPCSKCQGEGRVGPVPRKITVEVPQGVQNNHRITISGMGDAGKRGGDSGDLFVVFSVKPHRFFKRDGLDILCDIPVSLLQAATGAVIEIPTVYGKSKIRIDPGTQAGCKLSFPNLGLPKLTDPRHRGNMIVTVLVDIPHNLTDRQRELLREFDEIEMAKSRETDATPN